MLNVREMHYSSLIILCSQIIMKCILNKPTIIFYFMAVTWAKHGHLKNVSCTSNMFYLHYMLYIIFSGSEIVQKCTGTRKVSTIYCQLLV